VLRMYWTECCGERIVEGQTKLNLRIKEFYSLFSPPDSVMVIKSEVTGGQK